LSAGQKSKKIQIRNCHKGDLSMLRVKHCLLWSIVIVVCFSAFGIAQEKQLAGGDVEKFAAALAAAKTDEERSVLLEGNKELVKIELRSALIKEGTRLFNQANFSQALATFQTVQKISEQMGDKAGIASAHIGIGNVLDFQGNPAQALEHFQRSLALSEELKDKIRISNALGAIGNILTGLGNLNQALDHYQRSLAIGEELKDKVIVANLLNNIGNIYRLQGDYSQALNCFEKSLVLREELNDKVRSISPLNNIGLIHNAQGNFEQALDYFQRTLALSEELKDKAINAITLNNIGMVYSSQGNSSRAMEYYRRSLALREELNNKVGISSTLNNIGIIYREQGNFAQALEYSRRSLALREELKDKIGIAVSLNNIGNILNLQGSYEQALEYYQKSLALREELKDKVGIASTLNNIGEIRYLQGNYEQALDYYRRGLLLYEELKDKADISTILSNIGELYYAKGNYEQGLEVASRAADLARKINDLEHLWRARSVEGLAYRALNKRDQARQAFEEVIRTIETIRAQSFGGAQAQQLFFEDRIAPYYDMVDLLIAQNNNSEALAYAERAKARVILDVLQSGNVRVTKSMTPREQEQERKLNNELVSLNTQIYREKQSEQPDEIRLAKLEDRLKKVRLDLEAFRTNLYDDHPELKVRRVEVQPADLKAIDAVLLDNRSALLEFVVMKEKSFLFVMTRNGQQGKESVDLKVYTLEVKKQELANRITDPKTGFHSLLAERMGSFPQLARQLFDLLLKPAQEQLAGKTTLIIVPDGVLWELPFQALQSAQNRYLIEDYAISYSPSLTVLCEMAKSRKINRTSSFPMLLAFGDPALNLNREAAAANAESIRGRTLSPLPEAKEEVRALAQLYGTEHSKVYIGKDATEQKMKAEASSAEILHLAMHGIVDGSNPMYSHLVLSQAEESGSEDGLLEAWEIMNLDLKADLVILSACETARGRIGAGEGVIGLTWSLFVAGSSTMVVSQWQIRSDSTKEFMIEFHRNLQHKAQKLKSEISKAEALRQAALKLRRSNEYSHPFYWAGFVVIGNGF
jgi:CHAT domain-containing protein/Tfp pilus assembly protein PilF